MFEVCVCEGERIGLHAGILDLSASVSHLLKYSFNPDKTITQDILHRGADF